MEGVPSLSPLVSNAIFAEFGHKTPTAVQLAAIPQVVSGKNVAVEGHTGCGKTLGFVSGILHQLISLDLHSLSCPYAVIVSPTKELAAQTHSIIDRLLLRLSLPPSSLVLGGKKPPSKLPPVICGTPGSIVSLFKESHIDSRPSVRILIFDEADRLPTVGRGDFLDILATLIWSAHLQVCLFSATLSEEHLASFGPFGKNLVKIIERYRPRQPVITEVVETGEKFLRLCDLLLSATESKIIVYFASCSCAEYLGGLLQFVVKPEIHILHGKLSTSRRTRVYTDFEMRGGVLVTTDVAARGLDMAGVGWIVQYDPPSQARAFTHRIGRAGRPGTLDSTVRDGEVRTPLVLLRKNESAYTDFLRVRGFTVTENRTGASSQTLLRDLAALVLANEVLCKAATVGFVSTVRAYQNHSISHIFRLSDLDVWGLATEFLVSKMPYVPEFEKMGLTKKQKEGSKQAKKAHQITIEEVDAATKEDSRAVETWKGAFAVCTEQHKVVEGSTRAECKGRALKVTANGDKEKSVETASDAKTAGADRKQKQTGVQAAGVAKKKGKKNAGRCVSLVPAGSDLLKSSVKARTQTVEEKEAGGKSESQGSVKVSETGTKVCDPCGVCGKGEFKYRCSVCRGSLCSFRCYSTHKGAEGCPGSLRRTASVFSRVSAMNEAHLVGDTLLLEEGERMLYRAKRVAEEVKKEGRED